MKSKVMIGKQKYIVQVWMMKPLSGIYRFGLQIWGNGKIAPYAIRLSEEFIEDEIDNSKNKDYLEKVAMKASENHLGEMITLAPKEVIANLTIWFREAKQIVDKEKDVLVETK